MKNVLDRRRRGITDYGKRKKLLSGGSPRVVFRRTNRYIVAQYISSHEAKDKVEIGITSKALEKYGWPKEFGGSLSSLPASYLTGFLMGKKILKEKKKLPVFDFGMISSLHGSRPFAFLKGLVDSGLKMPHKSEEIFPEKDRIEGKHLKEDFSSFFGKIKSSIEKE